MAEPVTTCTKAQLAFYSRPQCYKTYEGGAAAKQDPPLCTTNAQFSYRSSQPNMSSSSSPNREPPWPDASSPNRFANFFMSTFFFFGLAEASARI